MDIVSEACFAQVATQGNPSEAGAALSPCQATDGKKWKIKKKEKKEKYNNARRIPLE